MVLALIIVSSLSTRGYSSAAEGFDVLNCAAARMVRSPMTFSYSLKREVNSTFQGQTNPNFLGLIPVLSIFDDLEGPLAFIVSAFWHALRQSGQRIELPDRSPCLVARHEGSLAS